MEIIRTIKLLKRKWHPNYPFSVLCTKEATMNKFTRWRRVASRFFLNGLIYKEISKIKQLTEKISSRKMNVHHLELQLKTTPNL